MIDVRVTKLADFGRVSESVAARHTHDDAVWSGEPASMDVVSSSRALVIYRPFLSVAELNLARSSHDVRNLLQVVASVFHLIDRQIDDDLRPLVRVGLTALQQVGEQRGFQGGNDGR